MLCAVFVPYLVTARLLSLAARPFSVNVSGAAVSGNKLAFADSSSGLSADALGLNHVGVSGELF